MSDIKCIPLDKMYKNAIHLPLMFYKNKEYNATRRCKLLMFSECINARNLDEPYEQIIEHITQIENECYKKAKLKTTKQNHIPKFGNKKFEDNYHHLCYIISVNLDEKSFVKSNYLKKQIKKKEYTYRMLPYLNTKQLDPETYKKYENIFNKKIISDVNTNYTELYKCSKCKKNKCRTERRYNRSLDEGVNLTIFCLWCGHQWNG